MTQEGGTTPVDPDEAAGLRQRWIATRGELDAAEAANINDGLVWAARRRPSAEQVLDDAFLRELHRRMFGNVWRWAGQYRSSEKNIGVEPYQIAGSMRDLVADARLWVTDNGPTAWSTDELCAWFHHRLVWVHPFPNGNGRHSRAATDLLLSALGGEPLTWGRAALAHQGEVRRRYMAALRAADRSDIGPLVSFLRS